MKGCLFMAIEFKGMVIPEGLVGWAGNVCPPLSWKMYAASVSLKYITKRYEECVQLKC